MKIERGLNKVPKFRVIKNRRAYLRGRRIRRFLTLAIIVTIFAYATHIIYVTQMNRLDELKVELKAYQAEHDEVMLRQGFYLNQVVRLEDEDYVAMLARERYFRSLSNEIVFRIIDGDSINSFEIADEYYEN